MTYRYTKNSYFKYISSFGSRVVVQMIFKGQELFQKHYQVHSSKRKGRFFMYKNERIYLKDFVQEM